MPHPQSPAGRHFDWHRLPAIDRAERVAAVYAAVQRSTRYIPRAVVHATGEKLSAAIAGIVPGLALALSITALTALSGALVGAALGAFAGGVGAVPGAAFGGAWGAEAGLVILEWLGLGFLAASVGKRLGSAARQAERAVEVAWRSVDAPATADLAITRAAEELASAVAEIFRGVLQGIVAFLLSEGAAAAAARVPELTGQLRGSRLGARFAGWVEQSWQRLITNPRLQPRPISAGPSNGGASRASGAWRTSGTEAQPSRATPREATPAAGPSIRRIPVSGARLEAVRDGALHNQDWRTIDVADFKATRAEGLDMAGLRPADEQAAKIMEGGGYSQPKIRQVLNSGQDFTPRPFTKGETLYAFDSADYVGKDADSPFWLDQSALDDVQSKFQRDGLWDRQGIKDYLALPCFNKADGIVQGTVTQDCVGVQSTVGPATENVSYIAADGTVVPGSQSLAGGGQQLSPPVGSIISSGASP